MEGHFALNSTEIGVAWRAFTAEHGERKAAEILRLFAESQGDQAVQKTTESRRHCFERRAAEIRRQLDNIAARDQFESVLMMVGPHVNEDKDLAVLHTTPGMSLYSEMSVCSEDEILAFIKTVAYAHNVNPVVGAFRQAVTTAQVQEDAGATDAAAANATDADFDAVNDNAEGKSKKSSAKRDRSDETRVIETIRKKLSEANKTDVKIDVFRDLNNNHFAWTSLVPALVNQSYHIIGWPSDVRFPAEFGSGKAIGGLRRAERMKLLQAIDARGDGKYAGIRFEKVGTTLRPNEYVIVCQDYRRNPPPRNADDATVRQYWRSSNGTAQTVLDAAGRKWSLAYDLDSAAGHTNSGLATRATQSQAKKTRVKGKGKGKGKGKETARAVKAKSKVRFESDDEDSFGDDSGGANDGDDNGASGDDDSDGDTGSEDAGEESLLPKPKRKVPPPVQVGGGQGVPPKRQTRAQTAATAAAPAVAKATTTKTTAAASTKATTTAPAFANATTAASTKATTTAPAIATARTAASTTTAPAIATARTAASTTTAPAFTKPTTALAVNRTKTQRRLRFEVDV
ncbi:hypothetical protein GGX14DRAFT_403928 [Mycena pura]|uniref:Uncharacterized protein n=1 Tax=Mycena pura TaxID=153505 RepID=A0AAD6UUX4_9AGAR|nr:hypothetical protein GGX14DRAFT_403928 [Mycena pura]